MSLPAAAAVAPMAAASVAINPIEHVFMTINTNPYFVGLMMLLLNLGGRFLGLEISKEQEKLFTNPWVRRALIFTVLFIATRNIFVAGIMTLFVLLIMSFLLNENSDLCLWKDSCAPKEEGDKPMVGLTPEETEIWRRLNEKQMRIQASQKKEEKEGSQAVDLDNIYAANLARLQ